MPDLDCDWDEEGGGTMRVEVALGREGRFSKARRVEEG